MDESDNTKILIWNANGLTRQYLELKRFLIDKKIDIALIAETHFTDKSYLTFPGYKLYATNHPDGKAHGGTAIIIKTNIKHTERLPYVSPHIQATAIQIVDNNGPISISSIYCPPRHLIKTDQYDDYFRTLDNRFIAGGDLNAKHTDWGSRLTNKKGIYLINAIHKKNCRFISTGEPTYWPTDVKKIPDLIDFCITKNINHNQLKLKPSYDLSSDHSPIILNYTSKIDPIEITPQIFTKRTDWDEYRKHISQQLILSTPLKTQLDIERSIIHFNDIVIDAGFRFTPQQKYSAQNTSNDISIKKQIKEKRKLRKRWQTTRSPADKQKLNLATKNLKACLCDIKNKEIEKYLKNLTPTHDTNYSLWKCTKKLKNQIKHQPPLRKDDNTWAFTNDEKAATLGNYFENVLSNDEHKQIDTISNFNTDTITKIRKTSTQEVIVCIKTRIKHKKAPGYDMVTGKALTELPIEAYLFLRNVFNAMFRLQYFPKVWKVAEIIALPKPGKNPTALTSYRPISLLPTISKIAEKLLHDRITPILDTKNIIPNHQFGFRKKHSTIQQIHRVTQKIISDMENKRYCVAVFLDVAKAFDKVWHKGLLHKIRTILPLDYYLIIKSYLTDRCFYIKYNDKYSHIHPITAGVPQGSVLGPLLYVLFTSDIPLPDETNSTIATFADDTILLSSDKNLSTATTKLQMYTNNVKKWFDKWSLKVNEDKSVQVIFTTRTEIAAMPIKLNNKNIQIETSAKYLGIHLDSKLNWKDHIKKKIKQIKEKFRQLHWLIGRNSKLNISNKLLIYKAVIKPIWTYGLQVWGTAKRTHINKVQRQQSKILRIITMSDRYTKNDDIHTTFNIPLIDEEIKAISTRYFNEINQHKNREVNTLSQLERRTLRRLKRNRPIDLLN